jgi:hypothetical protein
MDGIDLKVIAGELVAAARQTLVSWGRGEEKYLEPLLQNLGEDQCPADYLLKQYYGPWKKDMGRVIDYCGEV